MRGQQVDERIGAGRHGGVDRVEDLFVLVRACHGQDLGVVFADVVGLGAQAAGDDDLAVFLQGFADGVEAFRLGAVEKPAGVDDHRIAHRVIGRDCVAFGAQARENAFAIDQRFGAAKADHADGRLAVTFGLVKRARGARSGRREGGFCVMRVDIGETVAVGKTGCVLLGDWFDGLE